LTNPWILDLSHGVIGSNLVFVVILSGVKKSLFRSFFIFSSPLLSGVALAKSDAGEGRVRGAVFFGVFLELDFITQ